MNMSLEAPQKIVFLGTHAKATLLFRKELITWFIQQGHEVFVFADDYTPTTKGQVSKLGATPVDSPLNRANLNPIEDLGAMWQLKAELQKLSPDVVFAYFAKPIIFGTLAAAWARVKRRVALFEGLGYAFTRRPTPSPKAWLLRWIQKRLYAFTIPWLTGAVFLNPDDKNDLGFLPAKKRHPPTMLLKGIGVPDTFFQTTPPPSRPLTFLFVGRLLRDKGIEEFVKAAHLVHRRYPDVRFHIIGARDEQNPSHLSQTRYDRLRSTQANITWTPHTKTILAPLRQSHVVVLPSYREGFPRVIQEAMAASRPVIATRVPGCKEAVQEGKNGFLVAPFSPEALAQKMIYCLRHPAQLALMGRHAHKTALATYRQGPIHEALGAFILGEKLEAMTPRTQQAV
ncbi:glycosyltransferase family 4 protein [Candidatus Hepatobacter penaei]|uniref:glycosyltransferase family 4 protein n=1 Tax=Candidatus Hepatobacter penaei TaxID=1274402 RepID=UPI00069695B5|nr:glycosyltransferase family 4 protein [Candidatus Hepatobacter penaei]